MQNHPDNDPLSQTDNDPQWEFTDLIDLSPTSDPSMPPPSTFTRYNNVADSLNQSYAFTDEINGTDDIAAINPRLRYTPVWLPWDSQTFESECFQPHFNTVELTTPALYETDDYAIYPPLPPVGTYIPAVDGPVMPDYLLPAGSFLSLTPQAEDLEARLNQTDGVLLHFATASNANLSLQFHQSQMDSIFNYGYALPNSLDIIGLHPQPDPHFFRNLSWFSFPHNLADNQSTSLVDVTPMADTQTGFDSVYPPLGDLEDNRNWVDCAEDNFGLGGFFRRAMHETEAKFPGGQCFSVAESSEQTSLEQGWLLSSEFRYDPTEEDVRRRMLQNTLKKRKANRARRERLKLQQGSKEPRKPKKDDSEHQQARREKQRLAQKAKRARQRAERQKSLNLLANNPGVQSEIINHPLGNPDLRADETMQTLISDSDTNSS